MQRVAISLVLLFAFAGCGGNDNDPKAVAESFRDALAHGEFDKACDLLTSEAKLELATAEVKTCEGALKQVADLLDPADKEKLADAKVESVKTRGDKATVKFSDGDPMTVVKKSGHWLVALNDANATTASADTDARSNGRNMVSQVESCYTDTQDYSRCRTPEDLGDTGLQIGAGPGAVEVTDADATTYEIVAHSTTGHKYTLTKKSDGTIERTCEPSDAGGCRSDGTW